MREPVDPKRYSISQLFGVLSDAYKKYGLVGHNGRDYRTPSGTMVHAPISGTLTVGYDPTGYGLYVRIKNDKWDTVLGHLQSSIASDKSFVNEGDNVAFSDNTGNSTGAHLHWGVRPIGADKSGGFGGYIDPLVAIEMDKNIIIKEEHMDFKAVYLKLAKDVFGDDYNENWNDAEKQVFVDKISSKARDYIDRAHRVEDENTKLNAKVSELTTQLTNAPKTFGEFKDLWAKLGVKVEGLING
jgi:murein DD-endopeptidase MepM/ murein hydrolase activator NlpD